MKSSTFVLIGVVTIFNVSLSPTSVLAKDCDCEQHSAGASGSGSCSLTETSSRCSISYTATSAGFWIERAIQFVQYSSNIRLSPREATERAAGRYRVRTLNPRDVFHTLNQEEPRRFGREMFRDMVILTLAAAWQSDDLPAEIVDGLGLSGGGFGRGDLDDLFSQFRNKGCFEYRSGEVRFLVISRFSTHNGNCRR